jgi:cyanophycinase
MIDKIPKGKLFLIGGAEDKDDGENEMEDKNKYFKRFEILNIILPKKGKQQIEIVTTASTVPDEIEESYKDAFKKIGFNKVDFISIGNNQDANKPEFVERIQKAHAVLFSGGDQFRLSTILGETAVLSAIKEKYAADKNFIIAGTSAGAMVASKIMLTNGDEGGDALLKGNVEVSSGFGFIDHIVIDTHFHKRGRFGRLAQAVLVNPTCTGIGLCEDTALLIKKGREAECFGSGTITIIDPKPVMHTNIAYAEKDTPVCIQNLRVHILHKGNKFMLDTRKFIPAKEDLKVEEESTMDS